MPIRLCCFGGGIDREFESLRVYLDMMIMFLLVNDDDVFFSLTRSPVCFLFFFTDTGLLFFFRFMRVLFRSGDGELMEGE